MTEKLGEHVSETSKPLSWKPGRWGGFIVSETRCAAVHHETRAGHADTNHYGGYLVAESVPPELMPLLAASPKMYEALKAVAAADEQRQCCGKCGSGDHDQSFCFCLEHRHLMRAALEQVEAAIAQAERK